MPPSTSTAIQVAEITALKRLEGVEFTVKSAPLERLFRMLSNGQTTTVPRAATPRPPRRSELELSPEESPPSPVSYSGATRRYELDLVENGIPRQLVGFSGGRFDLWGSPELVHTRGPRLNLSILTAVGIDSDAGAAIMIPTIVSEKLLLEYTEGLKSAIRQLYIDYIGDRTHVITITCEHSIS